MYEKEYLEKQLQPLVKEYIESENLSQIELGLENIIKTQGYNDDFNLSFLYAILFEVFQENNREDLLDKPAEYIFKKIKIKGEFNE